MLLHCLPQVLAACTSPLTKVSLTVSMESCKLPELTAGPWLSALEELDLSANLPRLPPALATATRLRCLDVRRCKDLEISAQDVDRVLRPLQQLSQLRLRSWTKSLSPPAAARLFRALPLLRPPSEWEEAWWWT